MTTTTNQEPTEPAVVSDDDTNKNQQAADPPKDEEGLHKEYDVIICGTGLVQSILASALCRAGKSVLHCDGEPYYGELNAVLNLPYLQEGFWKKDMKELESGNDEKPATENDSWTLHPSGACHSITMHSTRSKLVESPSLDMGTRVTAPYGIGIIKGITHSADKQWSSLAVSMQDWMLADGSHPTAYFGGNGVTSDTSFSHLVKTKSVLPIAHVETERILKHHSRSFALDVMPQLLFASGHAVQGLLASNVAEYLEFKSLQGLFWMSLDKHKKWTLSRVPCSKGDVFGTKLLAPMDKRRLMKFLQLVLDYAIANQHEEAINETNNEETNPEQESPNNLTTVTREEEVQSLNERQLNQGRSLARPQNKAVSTDELQKLEECIENEMDFDDYLVRQQKLSPSLTLLVKHALALQTTDKSNSSTSLKDSMARLCQHVQALGRYGTTAFLIPLFGSGELPQSFCRSAAVHGGTYLLRRPAKQILFHEKEQCVKGIVLGGDKVERNELTSQQEESIQKDKTILCKHVVTCQEAVIRDTSNNDDGPKQHRILRRISILRGKLVSTDNGDQEQRHGILFPPGSLGGNSHAIHGVALDDSVQVAPSGCTVLHLTTTVDDNQVDQRILERAVKELINLSFQQEDTDNEGLVQNPPVEEIYHACFSFAVGYNNEKDEVPKGLHMFCQAGQSLVLDDAFERAKEIFNEICPLHFDFLSLSEGMDATVKERIGDYNDGNKDDETLVLESAMNMIEQKETTGISTQDEGGVPANNEDATDAKAD